MKRLQRKILVVDDERGVLVLLKKRLKVDGYDVISASDGHAAFKKAKLDMPNLILSDLMMPRLNGKELARKLRKDLDTKDIPIIFITAVMGVEKDKGNETIDIDGYLYPIFAKPLHNRKLLSTIRKAINRAENNQDPLPPRNP